MPFPHHVIEEKPHIFVEGKTDKYVILQLLKSLGIFAQDGDQKTKEPDRVEVVISVAKPNTESSGSKSELLDDLSQRIRSPKHAAIGYVFDADDPAFTPWSLQLTWDAVRAHLGKPPTSIAATGQIPTGGFVGYHSKTKTPIGVWLMPDNRRDGSVEDFLRDLIAEDDQIASFAVSSTRVAKDDHGAAFPEKDFKKATIEAWLAWQEEPGMTFGTAFQKDLLQKSRPLAERFVAWVKRLISDAQTVT